MLKYNLNNTIKKIKHYLDEYEYDVRFQKVNGYYNYYINPWQKYDTIQANLKSYDDEIVTLFQILLLGGKYSYEKITEILEKDFIDALLEVGFFINDNGVIYSEYSIVSYMGFYFVVSILPDYPSARSKNQEVYIGMDTYRLTSILPKKRITSHLDLCTGSGIQAIVESPFLKKTVALDVNANVIPVLRFNLVLNDVEDKITVVESDLYKKLNENEMFDLITANPPFIPIPEGLPFSIAGDGGSDGLAVIDKIIEGFDKYLQIGGNAIISGEGLGNENIPLLYYHIKKLLPKGYECKLILQSRISKNNYIENIISLYCRLFDNKMSKDILKEKWELLFKNYNANSYYIFILKVKRTNSDTSEFKIIHNYSRWNGEVKPQLSPNISIIEDGSSNALIKYENKILGSVPIAVAECLKMFTGERTMDEIIKSYKYSEGRYGEIRRAVENVCVLLDRFNGLSIVQ